MSHCLSVMEPTPLLANTIVWNIIWLPQALIGIAALVVILAFLSIKDLVSPNSRKHKALVTHQVATPTTDTPVAGPRERRASGMTARSVVKLIIGVLLLSACASGSHRLSDSQTQASGHSASGTDPGTAGPVGSLASVTTSPDVIPSAAPAITAASSNRVPTKLVCNDPRALPIFEAFRIWLLHDRDTPHSNDNDIERSERLLLENQVDLDLIRSMKPFVPSNMEADYGWLLRWHQIRFDAERFAQSTGQRSTKYQPLIDIQSAPDFNTPGHQAVVKFVFGFCHG